MGFIAQTHTVRDVVGYANQICREVGETEIKRWRHDACFHILPYSTWICLKTGAATPKNQKKKTMMTIV